MLESSTNPIREKINSNGLPIVKLERQNRGQSIIRGEFIITVVLATTLSGLLLPYQILYQGKTEACHPPAGVRWENDTAKLIGHYLAKNRKMQICTFLIISC